jgi:farnesyl-diphosphate farnesyltransferase
MDQRPVPLPAALLKDVSRSFYLTLRILPGSIRGQLGLAYLLARTTDTIADTQLISIEQRLDALQKLRQRIFGLDATSLQFGQLAFQQSSPAERILLERCESTIALLQNLSPADLKMVRTVLETITSGQELDLRRFARASATSIVALRTEAELDDYTYRVAGCVGEFWTRMCRSHVFPRATLDDSLLLTNSVRFGKGLQMVNILRDLESDLRLGRCYLPEEKLSPLGLVASDLLLISNEPRLRPLFNAYICQAEENLRAGWGYTNALPWTSLRVRLACAWPILIGLRTLELLRTGSVLDPGRRIKITRSEIKSCIWRSVLYYPWPAAWKRLVEKNRSGLSALEPNSAQNAPRSSLMLQNRTSQPK